MTIDDYLALGYATASVISRYNSQNVAEAVREAGYGATIEWGQGRAGTVGVVGITLRRRVVSSVVELADQVDPDAFVTVEEARSIRWGYMRTARHER